MLVSPYKPGGTPVHLAGRSRELGAIRDYLSPVVAHGHKADAQLVLHGPRGIGKTSVMAAAAQAAQQVGEQPLARSARPWPGKQGFQRAVRANDSGSVCCT